MSRDFTNKEPDHHNGFYLIKTPRIICIEQFKQMVVFGKLDLDGILLINGQLIIEL